MTKTIKIIILDNEVFSPFVVELDVRVGVHGGSELPQYFVSFREEE